MVKIGIFGMGAVGCALYSELCSYEQLYVLADEERIQRYLKKPLVIEDKIYTPNYTSSMKMDIIFVCVKNYQLESALIDLEVFVKEGTVLLPLMNGITAHDILLNHFPKQKVIYGVINVEANKVGSVVHTGKITQIQFGEDHTQNYTEEVRFLDSFFQTYAVRHQMRNDMKRRVWQKWMLNMGINQISALCDATYKDMAHPYIQKVLFQIFEEVYTVAQAYQIELTREDVEEAKNRCKSFDSNRVTSLTLDFRQHKKTEIDSFSYILIQLAEKKNIKVPINSLLYALLKAMEDNHR